MPTDACEFDHPHDAHPCGKRIKRIAPDFLPRTPGLICPDCGGPAVTWEDGFVLCDDCAILRAKKWQMDREHNDG